MRRTTLLTHAARRPPQPGAHRPARRAGCTAAASSAARHLPGRPRPHRPGPGRACRGAGTRGAARGDDGRGDRHGHRQPAGARRRRGHRRRRSTLLDRAGRHPAGRAVAARRSTPALPTLLDHAAGHLAAPGAAGDVGARRRLPARLPVDARRPGFTEVADPEARRVGDRVRRQRVRGRLLRPAGLPRPEPAVLQAAAGRGLRAGLRGRPGVPGRAARHRPAPGRVRLARRRARLHRGPPRRARRAARRASPGMVAAVARARRRRPSSGSALDVPEVPDGDPGAALPPRRSRSPARPPTSPTWRPRTSGRWASGRWREHGSDFVAVEGYPMAKRPFYTHPRARRRPALVATASTCSSAAWSWSRGGQRLHRLRRLRRRPAAPRRATRPPTRRTSRRSGTACRRTAASRSGWSAGWPGWSRRPTSARSRCSRATCTGSRPSREPRPCWVAGSSARRSASAAGLQITVSEGV